MIEPFCWLIEHTVFQITNYKDSRKRIKLKKYAHRRDGNVVMEYNLSRRFLEMLERTFQKERQYEYRYGAKTKDELKSVQEITITKIAVQNLSYCCMDKQKTFSI